MQPQPQHTVEACDVIHMRVRNEGMAGAQKLARGERAKIAQIEQHRAPPEAEIEIDAGVALRPAYQARLDQKAHGAGAGTGGGARTKGARAPKAADDRGSAPRSFTLTGADTLACRQHMSAHRLRQFGPAGWSPDALPGKGTRTGEVVRQVRGIGTWWLESA